MQGSEEVRASVPMMVMMAGDPRAQWTSAELLVQSWLPLTADHCGSLSEAPSHKTSSGLKRRSVALKRHSMGF
uniref:Uncharacterized protein n=1 Tax=Knipowitschia caucasica TaxID=637954 RepID=A0AAV2ITP6_KNICA